ncbi:hypothetical protein J6590_025976 [Homalodisca vitripennis]|nr:hypothetical protein J6590_025976 [Homalodisca vitripennis]
MPIVMVTVCLCSDPFLSLVIADCIVFKERAPKWHRPLFPLVLFICLNASYHVRDLPSQYCFSENRNAKHDSTPHKIFGICGVTVTIVPRNEMTFDEQDRVLSDK